MIMSEDLKKHTGYLELNRLMRILLFIKNNPCSIAQIKSYFNDNISIVKNVADSFSLMQVVGIVKQDSNKIFYLTNNVADEEEIIAKVLKFIVGEKCAVLNTQEREYSLFINHHYYAIRNFLISSGVIENADGASYKITDKYNMLAEKIKLRKKTLEQFKKELSKKEEAGERAEKYVLALEKKKFPGKTVEYVALEDVGAGYDIKSYLSESSLFHDKFIEVKSYSESDKFYWTRNEVETAKQLGENYYLYLVKSFLDSKPKEIKNPYANIFRNTDFESTQEVISYKVSCIINEID